MKKSVANTIALMNPNLINYMRSKFDPDLSKFKETLLGDSEFFQHFGYQLFETNPKDMDILSVLMDVVSTRVSKSVEEELALYTNYREL